LVLYLDQVKYLSLLQAWDVFKDPLANVKCDFWMQNIVSEIWRWKKLIRTLQEKMASNDKQLSIWKTVQLFDGKCTEPIKCYYEFLAINVEFDRQARCSLRMSWIHNTLLVKIRETSWWKWIETKSLQCKPMYVENGSFSVEEIRRNSPLF